MEPRGMWRLPEHPLRGSTPSPLRICPCQLAFFDIEDEEDNAPFRPPAAIAAELDQSSVTLVRSSKVKPAQTVLEVTTKSAADISRPCVHFAETSTTPLGILEPQATPALVRLRVIIDPDKILYLEAEGSTSGFRKVLDQVKAELVRDGIATRECALGWYGLVHAGSNRRVQRILLRISSEEQWVQAAHLWDREETVIFMNEV
ncbi:uncharacterized protein VTP21DRAFT_7515 [Calcarisporiella thermophila]|uniref:uncharacterized protein n=1 Tax=Calcarisporiella thermophila TaxID=911321 RepID=UPI00374279B4